MVPKEPQNTHHTNAHVCAHAEEKHVTCLKIYFSKSQREQIINSELLSTFAKVSSVTIFHLWLFLCLYIHLWESSLSCFSFLRKMILIRPISVLPAAERHHSAQSSECVEERMRLFQTPGIGWRAPGREPFPFIIIL